MLEYIYMIYVYIYMHGLYRALFAGIIPVRNSRKHLYPSITYAAVPFLCIFDVDRVLLRLCPEEKNSIPFPFKLNGIRS